MYEAVRQQAYVESYSRRVWSRLPQMAGSEGGKRAKTLAAWQVPVGAAVE